MSLYPSDTQTCSQCGGLCCQGHSGVWVDPQRFERLFFAGQKLQQGALPEGVVLRDLGGIQVAAPQTLEHGCFFLGPDGCRLDAELRPGQCLALTPSIDTLLEGEMRCTMPPECGSHTARLNWRHYWQQQTLGKEQY
ncbi:MAG: hypothetical protein C0624_04680 [Desulfuromonas sp.]|mgnify:CR=1 FL=1|nr:MAG: hypothetical protein C0624_04680 [Desulfuromonas sp.]